MRAPATKNVIESLLIGVILTGLSYFIGLEAGWISHLNLLEVFAVFTSYSCTYLCVKERRINYPIGAVSTAAYSLLFFQQGLFASAILNAYLTPALIYGWFRWRKDDATRPVSHVSLKWYPVYIGVTALSYLGALGLNTALGGHFALTDTLVLVGTILAQFLLDNKKIENWIVWLAVDIIAIFTYAHAGIPLVALQYVAFAANAFYGMYVWHKSHKDAKGLAAAQHYKEVQERPLIISDEDAAAILEPYRQVVNSGPTPVSRISFKVAAMGDKKVVAPEPAAETVLTDEYHDEKGRWVERRVEAERIWYSV